ncbi:MAG: D-hexose-6-phosphate mutarotase [Sulfuricaulis sp.]
MTDLAALNAAFGIPDRVTFKEGRGGLVVAEVANIHGTATIVLQGAHVLAWAPRGQKPVIWCSRAAKFLPGKSIRGGVPICWPWFGPHAVEASFPAHGFARTVPWEVIGTQTLADNSTRLVFRLLQSEYTRTLWPYASSLECHITVGAGLEIELVTHNQGGNPITIGAALHTYFEVSDVSKVAIHGLEDCFYLDKVDGGRRNQQSGPVTIGKEIDRIYLNSTADCLIDDPGFERRLRISKHGSSSSVVWNPWTEKASKMGDFGDNGYLNMVCVESANAADDVVTIPPGGTHRLQVRYSVESLR